MLYVKRLWIVLGLCAIALLAACEEATDTEPLPTLMVLPSLTPTETPSNTPEPTETSTSTLTPTATETPLPTETETQTPTATNTNTPTTTRTPPPTPTNTPSQTNTPTNTNTPRPTRTPRDTLTPSATPTQGFPTIEAFAASSTSVSANMPVVLAWTATGDTARIERVNNNGMIETTSTVQLTGDLTVTVPAAPTGQVYYRLVVLRGGQQVTQTLEIAVQAAQCTATWFFGNDLAATENIGCPTTAGQQLIGAYQLFESGVMFNVTVDSQNLIFALIRSPGKNGQYIADQYGRSVNHWDGVSAGCVGIPMAGTILPQQQFGWMACTQLALGGFWIDGTGYALSSIDLNPRTIQRATDGTLFIDAPDGAIYRLNPLLPGALTGTWKRIR